MLNENQLNALPERVYQRFRAANDVYIRKIGERIGEIGRMSPSQAQRLLAMKDYGDDISAIESAIKNAANLSADDISEIFDIIVEDNYKFAERFYKTPQTPLRDNANMQSLINRYVKQAKEQIFGISQTTAFAKWDSDRQNFILTPLAEAYQSNIEQAVIAVSTGVGDYKSEMRRCLREFAKRGINTVNYATNYTRRLDTAVRQNILWGAKECNQEAQKEIGREFGSDGFEISYHSNPRPSHAPMGGVQFADSPAPVTIDGKTYPSFYQPYGGYGAPADLLNDYNCLHFTFPILLGASEPNYDDAELLAYKEDDNRAFEFEGHSYTGYEATQMQRRIETEIRKNKDLTNIAKAAGDDDLRRSAQGDINLLKDKYIEFSNAARLPVRADRMSVRGFKSVKPHLENQLHNSNNGDIIKAYRRSANRKADEKQFRRYKDVLGNNAPKTFEEFRNIKYGDTELWENYKDIFRNRNYLQERLDYKWLGEKGFIPAHTKIEKITIIAGEGANSAIYDIARLVKTHGGKAENWRKQAAKIVSKKYSFDVHFYEYDGIQYDVKLKHRKEHKP